MKVQVNLREGTLKIDTYGFFITCDVRNELNGRRKINQVVRSIPEHKPHYPRPFPKGTWKIIGVEYTTDPVFAPVKILTDAFRMVRIWELDENGDYRNKAEEITKDTCYWMHFSVNSKTTHGCIRLNSEADALKIAELIENEMITHDYIELEVT